MSKIDIYFDNIHYPVDEASLSDAASILRNHLQTVMNGSGAVISLGGTPYNIDSAKLTAATNAFVSHLGTISGSGKKVSVNGVEYSIDSNKIANAVADLHTILGNLPVGGDDGDDGSGDDDIVIKQVVLAPQTFNFAYFETLGCYCYNSSEGFLHLNEGSKYVVVWDGIEYQCEAVLLKSEYSDAYALGNIEALSGGNNGMPFVISSNTVTGGTTMMAIDTAASHTVAIYKLVSGNGEITKNEHGFYYNVPYYGAFGYTKVAIVLQENGQALFYADTLYREHNPNDMTYSTVDKLCFTDIGTYTYDGTERAVLCDYAGETLYLAMSDDGLSFVLGIMGEDDFVYTITADTTVVPHAAHYGEHYYCTVENDVQSMVCNEDGTMTYYESDEKIYNVTNLIWNNEYSGVVGELINFAFSLDGKIMYNYAESTNSMVVYAMEQSSEDGSDETEDILDNEFPIQFNSLEVVNNTPFDINGVQLVRVSDNTVTDEELSSLVVNASMSGMTITVSCAGMDNEGDYSLALYSTSDESMAAYIVSVNTPFEHNGSMVKTGLYITNCALPLYGSMNVDITIEKIQ